MVSISPDTYSIVGRKSHKFTYSPLTACVMCLSGLGDPLCGVLLDPVAALSELCAFKGGGSDQRSLSTVPPVAPCGSDSGPVLSLSRLSGVGPIWRRSTLVITFSMF